MYILHLFEKTSPPFILYLDFTVRITGPLKVPEDSLCNYKTLLRLTAKIMFYPFFL